MDRIAHSFLEVKFAGGGDEDMTFEGYGSTFNNMDHGGDVIEPGAFAASLAAHKAAGTMPLMLLEHGMVAPLPVGRWTDMTEDGAGLRVKGQLLPTTDGKDTYIALKAGALSGLSIGYRVKEHVMRSRPEEPRRRIKSADLMEVSIVASPMNDRARVLAVKAAGALPRTVREVEHFLRDAGFPAPQAKSMASAFRPFEAQRDAGEGLVELADLLRRNIAILKGK